MTKYRPGYGLTIQNPYGQVIENLRTLEEEQDKIIELEEKEMSHVTYSIQDNDGARAFLGRGLAYTGGAYATRYSVPVPIELQHLVVYFDRDAVQGWADGENFGILIYRENPQYGGGTPTNPPCPDPGSEPGSGENLFPGGGTNDFHQVPRNEVFCFNHGRDPKNNLLGRLGHRAYTVVQLGGIKCPTGSALTLRISPTNITGWENADVTVELYYAKDRS